MEECVRESIWVVEPGDTSFFTCLQAGICTLTLSREVNILKAALNWKIMIVGDLMARKETRMKSGDPISYSSLGLVVFGVIMS